MADIVLVTGREAAGKATVSALLAHRFEYGVHLGGDAFRRFIVDASAMTEHETVDLILGALPA